MKRIIALVIVGIMILNPIEVKAETFAEKCQRLQQEADKEIMDKLEKDGNLTQEAIESIDGKNSKRKANKKYKETSKVTSSSKSTNKGDEINKGYVYDCDELHVVGLPTNEKGYTKAGDYGKID